MTQTITKKDVINTISRKKELNPEDVRTIIQEFLDCIAENLCEGKRFEFRDFGIFETVKRKQKVGRNPKIPEVSIIIPDRNTVKFIPGKKLKLSVANSQLTHPSSNS